MVESIFVLVQTDGILEKQLASSYRPNRSNQWGEK